MLNKLSKRELLELITAYDLYIQRANDENSYKCDWYPVCVEEFYKNEFREYSYE